MAHSLPLLVGKMVTPVFFDMVNVNAVGSPGTAAFLLGGAVPGYQAPAGAAIPNNTYVSYRASDGTGWETAHGQLTISGSSYTLARGIDTIESSNSNALVNFGRGVTIIIAPISIDINAWESGVGASGVPGSPGAS